MSQLPDWLRSIRQTLPDWLDRLADRSKYGRFRYALDAFEQYDLDSSHMAHNIVFTTGGGRSGLPDERQRREWIDYLTGLQRPEDGLMIDSRMEEHLRSALTRPTAEELFALRRWTTRNGLMTVIEMGGKPRYPLAHPEAFRTPGELVSHIEQLNWSLPWSAGSRTGAVILFQHFNRLLGDDRADELIRAAVGWLTRNQRADTGAWSDGSAAVSPHQLINGIMKIWIQVLPIADLPVQYPERVVDLCIAGIRTDPVISAKLDGCSIFDVALVLEIALRHTDHRRDEVADLARQFLPRLEPMTKSDGAFSYFPDRSLDDHSGLCLAPSKPQSDMVGTAIHCHTIALLASLAGFSKDLGWTPLTQWRMRL